MIDAEISDWVVSWRIIWSFWEQELGAASTVADWIVLEFNKFEFDIFVR